MQLELEIPDSDIYVKHYTAGIIKLANTTHNKSIIFDRHAIIQENWPVKTVDELTLESIEILLDAPCDIILLGTGVKTTLPPNDVIATFARAGKALDFMSSDAACRTFNILAQEAREVIAAIIA
ncbi:Mth938-like domain-containing protein [Facilibium subflavum]|uniref:Mth938-like domain-containing protein n=1 Tax=Facilibium subflavum TaxID=2219058 RepID=UPI000E6512A1|nr:Mth938-like domain-containing protein [Facilibium subflavum]